MRVTRRSIGVTVRRWWGELLIAFAWIALLFVAEYTSRTPQLLAGWLLVFFVLGSLRLLEDIKQAMQEGERDIAASVVESVSVPRDTTPREAERLEAFRAHIARSIRGHGAHLREARHG